MVQLFQRIAASDRFQNFITLVILFAGVLVGVETYPSMVERFEAPLHLLDKLVLGIFVLEAVIKIGAQGAKPWRYFYDPWNVFDFAIVSAAFLPLDAQYVTVLRLLRLLRVLRLVRALPRLQILVGALIKSIPSMGYVGLLLALLFYVYGVSATFLFGHNDPVHFGQLQASLLSLFQVVTLEGWADLLMIQVYGCDKFGYGDFAVLCTQPMAQPTVAVAFFVSFILIGTMVMLNLFIGVIMNGMQEAAQERDDQERVARGEVEPSLSDELSDLQKELGELQERIGKLKARADRAPPARESAAA